MTMGTYPRLVDYAWDVVNQFIVNWQSEPYRWSREIDIQVEIASRLNTVFQLIGRHTILAIIRNASLDLRKTRFGLASHANHR